MFAREPGGMDEATCADCGKECEVPFKPKAVLPTARSVGRKETPWKRSKKRSIPVTISLLDEAPRSGHGFHGVRDRSER